MPRRRYYRKKRRYYGKRRARPQYRRRRRRANPTTAIVRQPQIAADRYRVKLRYMATMNLSDTTGGVSIWYQLRGNSLFDPDYTSAGNQPVGFDQLCSLYNHYRVYGSSVRVEFVSTATTNPPVICLVNSSDTATGIGSLSVQAASLNPYSRHRYTGASTGNAACVFVKSYMSTKRIFGVSNIQDEDFGASISANPTNSWFWNIGTTAADGASTFTMTGTVYITYYCEFSQLTALTFS